MNSCILLILHFFVLRIIGVIDWISISLSGLSIETFTNFRFVHAYRCRRIFDVTAVFFVVLLFIITKEGLLSRRNDKPLFQCLFNAVLQYTQRRERRLTRINFSHKKKYTKYELYWLPMVCKSESKDNNDVRRKNKQQRNKRYTKKINNATIYIKHKVE